MFSGVAAQAARHLSHSCAACPTVRPGTTRPAAGWCCCFAVAARGDLSGLYVANDVADEGPLTELMPAAIANAITPSTGSCGMHCSQPWPFTCGDIAVRGRQRTQPAAADDHGLQGPADGRAATAMASLGARRSSSPRAPPDGRAREFCSWRRSALGRHTWPRISPPGLALVCRLTYQSPASNCLA